MSKSYILHLYIILTFHFFKVVKPVTFMQSFAEEENVNPKDSCIYFNSIRGRFMCLGTCLDVVHGYYMFSYNRYSTVCMCCFEPMLGNILTGPAWESFIPSNCFANYTFYDTEEFRICLKYYPELLNYEKARKNCRTEGGDLVKIDSKRKYEIFKMYLEPFRATGEFLTWIQAILENGTFKFHDGTPIPLEGACEFSNSKNPGENHMRTKSKSDFICSDIPGYFENGYVCEMILRKE